MYVARGDDLGVWPPPPVRFGFALIVLCLSLQVEDRDYLEKVNGKLFITLVSF